MRDRIDPAVVAELAAVDAALSGEREDAELTLIREEVRAVAPAPSPAFAQRLDEAVSRGFVARPAAAGPARRRSRWSPPRVAAAAGGLAAALVALVVALSTTGGAPVRDTLVAPATGPAAATSAAGGVTAAAPEALPSASPADAAAPARGPRRVERAAQITLATRAGRLQRAVDETARIADRLGGFVARSDVSAGQKGGEAHFDLRVPVNRLDDALAALSRLGHVRSRSQQVQDVTSPFDSARARLHDAVAERDALLRALAAATTQPQIDSIHARLDVARSRIAHGRARLHAVRRRTALARVQVTILATSAGSGVQVPGSNRWTPARGVHDALRVLSAAVGLGIVALAAMLPFTLLGLAAALVARRALRRRRERALDAPAGAVVSV